MAKSHPELAEVSQNGMPVIKWHEIYVEEGGTENGTLEVVYK